MKQKKILGLAGILAAGLVSVNLAAYAQAETENENHPALEKEDEGPENNGPEGGPDGPPGGPGGSGGQTALAGFVILVKPDGTIIWEQANDDAQSLMRAYDVIEDECTVVRMVADNDEELPYLYPEKDWKIVFGTVDNELDTPEWYTEEIAASVESVFEEKKDVVYSQFDYEAVRELSIDDTIEKSPDADYELTEEDMDALRAYVRKEDTLNVYSRDSVIDTVNKYCGSLIGNTLQGSFVRTSMQLKSLVISDEKASEMGIMPRGVTSINFLMDVVGSYFDFDEDSWVDCNLDVEGYPYAPARYLFDHGLYVYRDDGSNDWFLSTTNGEILYRANDSEVGPAQAFAALIDEEGTVYWRSGIDGMSELEEAFAGEISKEYICVHVKPVLDPDEATIEIPDGLDPSIMHNYVYFDPAAVWTFSVEGDAPEWFTQEYEENAKAAFDEWYQSLNDNIDFDGVMAIWSGQPETIEMTDEDYSYLKQWARVWQKFTDEGVNPASAIKERATGAYGISVWADLIEYNTADWRVHHEVCTGSAVQAGYEKYTQITAADPDYYNLTSVVPGSVLDMQTALIASYMNIDWGDEAENPYECVAKLVADGLVPNTDGVTWYLTNTDTAEVLCEIPAEELLAD